MLYSIHFLLLSEFSFFHCDGFDLDFSTFGQTSNLNSCSSWKGRVEKFSVYSVHASIIFHILKINIAFHDIVRRRFRSLENCFKILENQACLLFDTPFISYSLSINNSFYTSSLSNRLLVISDFTLPVWDIPAGSNKRSFTCPCGTTRCSVPW